MNFFKSRACYDSSVQSQIDKSIYDFNIFISLSLMSVYHFYISLVLVLKLYLRLFTHKFMPFQMHLLLVGTIEISTVHSPCILSLYLQSPLFHMR